MGLIDIASSASAWRGYEYYQGKRGSRHHGQTKTYVEQESTLPV